MHLRARVKGRFGQIVARLVEYGDRTGWARMTTGATLVREGDDVAVAFPLQATAWRLRAGHRVELVLYADGGPTFWPPPGETNILVRDVRLVIPTLAPSHRPTPIFAPPQTRAARRPGALQWIDPQREPVAWDRPSPASIRTSTTAAHNLGGTDYFITSRFDLLIDEDWQGWAAKSYRIAFERPGWSVRIDTRLEVRSAEDSFVIAWTINATENGEPFYHTADGTSVLRETV
ncbi:MAG: hypothetical protein ISS15_18305 [Alphaproteobacteria bacterium]|nr:hypothetical protein [Alphaproteobacteria bacterium]MBL6939024.1 hypothetical protein [Alphaproteobacteria bacterium]MBL7099616.1 hypothetical protein [Alphaproteobacteria bacterium]